jgi:hypothetical protein
MYAYKTREEPGNLVGIATGLRAGQPENRGWNPSVHIGAGAHPASHTTDTSGCFPGGREGDHSPPPSVEVKNGGAIPPLPHKSSWRDA